VEQRYSKLEKQKAVGEETEKENSVRNGSSNTVTVVRVCQNREEEQPSKVGESVNELKTGLDVHKHAVNIDPETINDQGRETYDLKKNNSYTGVDILVDETPTVIKVRVCDKGTREKYKESEMEREIYDLKKNNSYTGVDILVDETPTAIKVRVCEKGTNAKYKESEMEREARASQTWKHESVTDRTCESQLDRSFASSTVERGRRYSS